MRAKDSVSGAGKYVLGRISNWFLFNVIFALVPIAAVVAYRWQNGTLKYEHIRESTLEMYFFTVVICVTAIMELGYDRSRIEKGSILSVLWGFFILCAVLSAMLYGQYIATKISGTGRVIFWDNSFYLSLGFALFAFFASLYVQIHLGRVEFLVEMSRSEESERDREISLPPMSPPPTNRSITQPQRQQQTNKRNRRP